MATSKEENAKNKANQTRFSLFKFKKIHLLQEISILFHKIYIIFVKINIYLIKFQYGILIHIFKKKKRNQNFL